MMPLVLLVESDADLRSAISSTLSRAAYHCDAVAGPADALLRLRDCEYAYIVVDVETIEPIESLHAALEAQRGKVVFITGDDDPAALHKPFDNAQLLARLG